MDARGRHSPRFLPHGLGRADRGGHRQSRHGDCLASSQRGAQLHVELRGGREKRVGDRARAGICRRTVCDPEHTLRESGSSRAYADRLVPLGLEYSTCIRDPDDGCRNRARARPRSQGHAHRADRSRPRRRRREIGERFLELRRTVRTHIQSTPADCAASPSLRRKKANGAASCRKGTALASPRIAVSSATSPPSSRSR